MASNPESTYPLATGEVAAARLALIECVCGPLGREVMRTLGVLPRMLASASWWCTRFTPPAGGNDRVPIGAELRAFEFCDRVPRPPVIRQATAAFRIASVAFGSGTR
jgi:hypothetical protein